MSRLLLHIPQDFEQRDEVRTLGRLLAREGSGDGSLASLLCLRLWLDWARNGVDWRPLSSPLAASGNRDWSSENLVYLIEQYVLWGAKCGDFVNACLSAGVLHLVKR